MRARDGWRVVSWVVFAASTCSRARSWWSWTTPSCAALPRASLLASSTARAPRRCAPTARGGQASQPHHSLKQPHELRAWPMLGGPDGWPGPQVHLRISSPPVTDPCFYGMDFPSKEELFANQVTAHLCSRRRHDPCTACRAAVLTGDVGSTRATWTPWPSGCASRRSATSHRRASSRPPPARAVPPTHPLSVPCSPPPCAGYGG